MKIYIEDPKNILKRDFLEWLSNKLRDSIIAKTDLNKLKKFDQFLNSIPSMKSIYSKKIYTKNIIMIAANNIVFSDDGLNKILEINSNMFIPNLDQIKLISICKFINYGNSEISGYPIFTEVFEEISNNLPDYVDMYVSGVFQ